MTDKPLVNVGTVGHIDFGKTTMSLAVGLYLAMQTAPDPFEPPRPPRTVRSKRKRRR